MCIAVITFPSTLAVSSSADQLLHSQSSSSSSSSSSLKGDVKHVIETEDEPIELFVSLRHLQSHHHTSQHSHPSTHRSPVRMAWNEEDGDVQMDEVRTLNLTGSYIGH